MLVPCLHISAIPSSVDIRRLDGENDAFWEVRITTIDGGGVPREAYWGTRDQPDDVIAKIKQYAPELLINFRSKYILLAMEELKKFSAAVTRLDHRWEEEQDAVDALLRSTDDREA